MRKAFLQFPKALFAWCTINSCCDHKCLMHSGGTERVGLRVTKSLAEDVSRRLLSFSSELSLFISNILQPYTNVWNHKQATHQGDGEIGQLLLLQNIVKAPNLLLVKLKNMWQSVCTSRSFLPVAVLTASTTYGDIYRLNTLWSRVSQQVSQHQHETIKCRAYLGSHSLPIIQDFFLGMKMAYSYLFVPQIRQSHNCNKRKKNNNKKQKWNSFWW